MRTVQMTLDDDLVKKVDEIAGELNTTRSAFTRVALQEAINRFKARHLEQKHRKGYEAHPANRDEFSVWEKEQNWGDE